MYTGRFAPSPTGPLHFGSLVAALASWLDARAAGGTWHIRIEDLDRPREQPGAAQEILAALQAFGLHWDGTPQYQSRRSALYEVALARLAPHTYWCGCSRREIADSAMGVAADGAQIYPGTCRGGLPPGKRPRVLRVRVAGTQIAFVDRVQGAQRQALETDAGDFIVRRNDGAFAYQLAVVIDDAEQRVTDVVRGADLLDSTPRQIFLQRLLGYALPCYLHVPVAVDAAGEKLSKQTGAAAVDVSRPGLAIRKALRFLGQPDTADLRQAIGNWDPSRIPACRFLRVP